ncbi:MAG: methyltransferase [Deltaproteobacteria bacterium]|nr:methyltransferase [Deltaproteobacteria bacterium]
MRDNASPLTPHAVPIHGPDETADAALGGAVRVIQPRMGYRFSLDSILLARFASERPVDAAVDLGCGCGVVALCLLALGGARRVVGVDVQAEMVERARRSAEANGWEERCCRFLASDVGAVRQHLEPQSVALVVANPPYRRADQGRHSPDAPTAAARHEVAGTLGDFVSAAAFLLRERGALCLVYPAPRLTALLSACRGARLEPKVLWLTQPRDGRPASLALLRCVKGAGEGLEVRAPLRLHGGSGRYSEEAQRLLGAAGTDAPAPPSP